MSKIILKWRESNKRSSLSSRKSNAMECRTQTTKLSAVYDTKFMMRKIPLPTLGLEPMIFWYTSSCPCCSLLMVVGILLFHLVYLVSVPWGSCSSYNKLLRLRPEIRAFPGPVSQGYQMSSHPGNLFHVKESRVRIIANTSVLPWLIDDICKVLTWKRNQWNYWTRKIKDKSLLIVKQVHFIYTHTTLTPAHTHTILSLSLSLSLSHTQTHTRNQHLTLTR